MSDNKMYWKCHTPNLINDIITHMNPVGVGVVRAPLQIFKQILSELTELSIEIDDPRLHLIMCKLTLYESADPESKEFDKDIFKKLEKQIKDLSIEK